MFNCKECWSNPCECGYDYKDYDKEKLSRFIAHIAQYRSKKEAKEIIKRAEQIVDEINNWQDKVK